MEAATPRHPIVTWMIRLVVFYCVFATAAFIGDYLYVTFCTNFTFWGFISYPFLKTNIVCLKGLQLIESLNTMITTTFWVTPVVAIVTYFTNLTNNYV
jgi:hypothetical protein